ncbi:MAG: glycosyltransferase family 4 protein [Salinibacter sp.]
MRICFVTHYDGLYGANRSLLGLIEGLEEYGVESLVVLPSRGDLTEVLRDRNVPYVVAPFKWWMTKPSHQWKAPARLTFNLVVAPVIATRIAFWHPDLIHTNSSVTPVGALVAELLSLPHTWHIREFGDLDYGLRRDLGDAVFRWGLERSRALVAVSEAVRRRVLEDLEPPTPVVYNGVISEDRARQIGRSVRLTRGETGKSSCFTFAILGRIQPSKGQEQAVRAVSRLRKTGMNVHLLIAGDGRKEHESSLKTLVRRLGVADTVSFLGFVDEPFSVYRKTDAVLMCSENEAMGRVTAEGMAAARPIVGRNSGGTSELVNHGVNGLLYDEGVGALADCMQRLADDPEWARELGLNGWEKAVEKFTLESYAQKMYNVLSSAQAVDDTK